MTIARWSTGSSTAFAPGARGGTSRSATDRGGRVWRRHSQLSAGGIWDQVLLRLLAQADATGQVHWDVSADSTSAPVHQHAATLSREVAVTLPSHTGAWVELQRSAVRAS